MKFFGKKRIFFVPLLSAALLLPTAEAQWISPAWTPGMAPSNFTGLFSKEKFSNEAWRQTDLSFSQETKEKSTVFNQWQAMRAVMTSA